nr:hypothetical protein [Tanacetum cinerariifolium]
GYPQEEGIYYDEVFAPVARIEEEVYVCEPPEFEDPEFPDRVYNVEKALYGLHQAPKAWHETLSTYLLDNGFHEGKPKMGLWYPKDSPFNLKAYTDSDYAGASLDRNSTTGEYVAASNCYRQALWIQNQMLDYRYNFMNTKIFIDNESTICIVKNPVFHSKTKNIEIQHHFIRDSSEKKLIQMIKIYTDQNVTDLLLKAFDVGKFQYLIAMLRLLLRMNLVALWLYYHLSCHKPKIQLLQVYFDNMVKNLEGGVKFLMFPRQGKDFSGRVTPLFPTMIVQAQEELGGDTKIPTDTQHTPAIIQPTTSQPQRKQKPKKTRKKDTELPQTSVPIEVIADEVVYEEMYDSGKDFSGRVTPLFPTMIVQAQEELGGDTKIPTDTQHTPAIIQPTTSQPQRKQKPKKTRKKDTELPQTSVPIEVVADEDMGIISKTQFTVTLNEPSSIRTSSSCEPMRQETMRDVAAQTRSERVSKFSNDPPLLRVNTLGSGDDRLKLTKLMELCTQLQSRVLALETTKTNQALDIGSLKRKVKKLEKKANEASLDDQEDASKQGRIIDNLDADEGVTLVDETHGRNDQDMFDTGILDDEEVVAEKEVSTADPVTTAGEVVTTTGVEVSTAATTPIISIDDITLTKELAALKSAKPMVKEPSVSVSAASTSLKVSAASTTSTTVTTTTKDKGIVMKEPGETTTTTIVDSQSLKEKGKAKMIEPKKPLKKKDQIMIDEELAERLQAEEQGELTIEERSKLFVELMNERKKHFAWLRAEEKRRKPPTKAQKRNQMCTYLKNMAGFTHNQLKNKSFEEVQKAFDSTMSWINSFIPMDKEKLDEKVEAEVDNDQEETKMKMYMKIVSNDEVAIDAIPLSTKPPIIVDWKIIKEGKISSYHIIRHDGTLKRSEEAYERVLWSDLKVMFEPDIKKKRYPLTPATITEMLNMKLQADHWNEMCYQLLKLMLKQQKKK